MLAKAPGSVPWQRVNQVLGLVEGDADALRLIENVLHACTEYVRVVVDKEASMAVARRHEDPGAVAELGTELDSRRAIAHNALISALRACNRILFKTHGDRIPPGGLYGADPYHLLEPVQRVAIGDWAGEVVRDAFLARPR